MGRLIPKDKSKAIDMAAVMDKLGKIEDIEEELSIDIVTLFKALTTYAFNKDGEKMRVSLDYMPLTLEQRYWVVINENEDEMYFDGIDMYFLTDYGKTWALTKEELI